MSAFDYDVLVVGSGFGGSVTAFRAAEKGYSVGVMESGRRIPDSAVPVSNWHLKDFVWFPAAEMYGIQRMEVLDNVLLLCGAGVGGGSHIYAQTLYVPPRSFFEAEEWSDITDWADELAPYIDQAQRMLGVQQIPFMMTDTDRMLRQAGKRYGGAAFNRAPVGVYFGEPGVEADDPYFGGRGPRRVGCTSCGRCMVGCGRNSKNKLNTNYLHLAEGLGATVHELHEVYEINPLPDGGYEVLTRHPGWVQRGLHLDHKRYTAEQVVVSAHAYGTSKILLKMQHEGNLPNLSDKVGHRARTNSEMLLGLTIPYSDWEKNKERIHMMPGSVGITSAVWPDQNTSIEPNFFGVGNDLFTLIMTWHQDGHQNHPTAHWLKELATHPGRILSSLDGRHWSERTVVLLCMQTKDNYLDLYWKGDMVHSREGGKPTQVHIPEIEKFVKHVGDILGADENALLGEVINRGASGHFIGGQPIAETPDKGSVDPYQRAFGHPGLHVIDGSVMPANPGVNPTLMLTALAERAMSFWPNKGDDDPRPSLGSGYKRLKPVMPHRPYVPAGAHGELRLTATADQMIHDHPADQ